MRRVPVGVWLCLSLVFLAAPTIAQEDMRPWPTHGWQTASPEAQGMDSDALAGMLDYVARGDINVHSILVIRNGYLVLEDYRHPYTVEMPHQLNSATKSFTSALVGIAQAYGSIGALDQPMLDYFADRTIDHLDAAKQAITLENLLTMSAGFDWSTANYERPALGDMYASPDWVQFVLDRAMTGEPGERYVYNSGVSHLLAVIVEQATGQRLLDFARANLFEPLGIETARWQTDPQGHYFGGRGLDLTPRDMAKFGYLFLNNGEWDGQQIIPADYVAASTQKHIAARHTADGYGYQWWIDFRGYYMAAGAGGQYIIVDPAHKLVAVFTAGFGAEESISQRSTLFDDQILSAIKGETPLPDNPEGTAALEGAINALAHPTPQTVLPLPETAIRISGEVYTLAPNELGWESFQLTFSEGTDIAQSQLNGQPPLEIGLDDLYRVTTLPDGTFFAKGGWTADDRFVMDYTFGGAADGYQLTLTFEGQALKILLRDELSGRVYSMEGTAV